MVVFQLNLGLWVQKFSPNLDFLSILSATDMLESHSRALKTQILAKFPKKSWAILMAQWVGPGKGSQKHPHLRRKNTPNYAENPHGKRKNFLFDFDYKTCCIRRGFEQLSSSIAWRVIGLQSFARNVVFAGLQGFWRECLFCLDEM